MTAAEAGIKAGLEKGSAFEIWDLLSRPLSVCEAEIRSRCHNAYLGKGTSLCRVLGRYRMFVDLDDVGLSTFLLMDGFWEMWTTQALLHFVRPGMKVIDAGANLGYFSVLLADLAGPAGQVHCFEPNAALAPRLRKTLAVNGFGTTAIVHECALSDSNDEMTLVVPENEPKNGYLVATAGSVGQRTAVRRLDSHPDLLDADFIKIDVEGAEEGLWRGMRGLLDKGRSLAIFLEFTPARYADPAAFLGEILSHGFALARIEYTLGVQPISPSSVLAAPRHEDQMLVLTR